MSDSRPVSILAQIAANGIGLWLAVVVAALLGSLVISATSLVVSGMLPDRSPWRARLSL